MEVGIESLQRKRRTRQRKGNRGLTWTTTGKLSLELPPFMNIDYDTESRMVSLSIQDQEIKKQKEMWGTNILFRTKNLPRN